MRIRGEIESKKKELIELKSDSIPRETIKSHLKFEGKMLKVILHHFQHLFYKIATATFQGRQKSNKHTYRESAWCMVYGSTIHGTHSSFSVFSIFSICKLMNNKLFGIRNTNIVCCSCILHRRYDNHQRMKEKVSVVVCIFIILFRVYSAKGKSQLFHFDFSSEFRMLKKEASVSRIIHKIAEIVKIL